MLRPGNSVAAVIFDNDMERRIVKQLRTNEAERRHILTAKGNSSSQVGISVMLNPEHTNYVGQREIHQDISLMEVLMACIHNVTQHTTADARPWNSRRMRQQ